MRIINSHKIEQLAQFIAGHKHNYADWQFLSINILNDDLTPSTLFSTLGACVDSKRIWTLKTERALIILSHTKDSLALGRFEKGIQEQYAHDDISITMRNLANGGINQFAEILRACSDDISETCALSLRRMERNENHVMVLDDDLMILRQMEKILGSFAHVEAIHCADTFFERYKEYAPDLLFLDIHLGTAKGNELLRELKATIDPHAFVIMISSDTKEKMILDIKSSGVDGFLMKPLDKNRIYHWLTQSPTANVYKKSS